LMLPDVSNSCTWLGQIGAAMTGRKEKRTSLVIIAFGDYR
jgi:hypothetical protein